MQAEGLTRSIGNFGRSLDVAGLTNSEQVNFAKVASNGGLVSSTVREHYRILEDTLVGDQVPAFRGTRTRKPVAMATFYFFDIGVANTLRRTGGVFFTRRATLQSGREAPAASAAPVGPSLCQPRSSSG